MSEYNCFSALIFQILTVSTLYFVNIVLKLECPNIVRFHFDSSKVRGEGNSVIFINQEILPGPEDAPICLTFLTTTMDFSEIKKVLY